MSNSKDQDSESSNDYRLKYFPSGSSEQRRKKRQQNKKFSTQKLREEKIPFESFKNGDHIQIYYGNLKVDFWPSTGLFIDKISGTKKRGIFNLINFIHGKEKPKKN